MRRAVSKPVEERQFSRHGLVELFNFASLAAGGGFHAWGVGDCSRHHLANMTDAGAGRLGALLDGGIPVKNRARGAAAVGGEHGADGAHGRVEVGEGRAGRDLEARK